MARKVDPDYVKALRRRLREFNKRTRRRLIYLTGWWETAQTGDPQEILQALLDNRPDLEHLLLRHGAFYPLIDKVHLTGRNQELSLDRHNSHEKLRYSWSVGLGG